MLIREPQFKVMYWRMNSKYFYLPQVRSRVYIVGLNLAEVKELRSMEDWATAFQVFWRLPAKGDAALFEMLQKIMESMICPR